MTTDKESGRYFGLLLQPPRQGMQQAASSHAGRDAARFQVGGGGR